MKPDVHSLSAHQLRLIQTEARRVLEQADALGRFPTPVDDIIEAARHTVVVNQDIDEGFLSKTCRKVKGALKGALSKVLGVLDVAARVMHLDRTVHEAKLPFLKTHELGHGALPWQRDIYAITADCKKTIAPEVSEMFEREANVFASEVLFQIAAFTLEAAGHDFGIKTPMKLSKKYGASVYASVRRYVSTHGRACAVVVLEPPEVCGLHGFVAKRRRVIASPFFAAQFGELAWPEKFTPDDEIGKMVPLGNRKMSRPRAIVMTDQNGARHECIAEAFRHPYQVFILICVQATITKKILRVSA